MSNVLAIAHVVVLEMVRRKDVYVLLVLTALVTVLLGSARVFGDLRAVRYVKEVCLSLIWISSVAIAVGAAARQIPDERETRTIFPLLAKPVSRWDVVAGKFLGCWTACLLSLAAFYLLFATLTGAREGGWPWVAHVQAFWLHALFCAVVVALTMLGSVVWSAVSANVVITVVIVGGILLVGRHLNRLAAEAQGLAAVLLEVSYYTLPHLEWFDMRDLIVHRWPPLAWWVVAFDTLYAACYTGLFLLGAWARFRRQSLH